MLKKGKITIREHIYPNVMGYFAVERKINQIYQGYHLQFWTCHRSTCTAAAKSHFFAISMFEIELIELQALENI